MLNKYIYNRLEGNKKGGRVLCTCGFNDIIPRGSSFERGNLYVGRNRCPKCQAILLANDKEMSFGPVKINLMVVNIEPIDNRVCTAAIDIHFIRDSYEIDFAKKNLKFSKENKNEHYRITIDAAKKKDDIVEAIDVVTGKKTTLANIQQRGSFYSEQIKFTKSPRLKFDILVNQIGTYQQTYSSFFSALISTINSVKRDSVKYEQIIKSGMDYQFLADNPVNFNEKGTNPVDMLGLKPYMLKYVKEDGLMCRSNILAVDRALGDKSIAFMEAFKEYMSNSYYTEKLIVLVKNANISIPKLRKYLKEDVPKKQGIYNEYEPINLLHDAYVLARDLELPFDKSPKALKRYHNILTKEYKMVEDKIQDKKFIEKINEYSDFIYAPTKTKKVTILNKEEEVQVPDTYAMVLPKDSQDLIREGKLMRHCVASYVNRVASGQCVIVFLRKQNDLGTPFVTIELTKAMDTGIMTVRQVKMKSNARLDDSKAIKFIKEWAKEKEVAIDSLY